MVTVESQIKATRQTLKNPAGLLTALTVKTCPESSVAPLFCWYEKYPVCLVEEIESHLVKQVEDALYRAADVFGTGKESL